MRCSRCGNDNPTENRFCGMCGATLLAPPVQTAVPETQTQRAASAVPVPLDPIPPEPPRARAMPHEEVPPISGPSFLGLNDPPPRKRASLKIDSHDAPHSGNLDYLLDDEHAPPPSGGVGKILVLLVVLLVAGGFFFMTWKYQGLSWLHSSNKPSAAAENPDESANTPASTASPNVTPQAESPAASPPAAAATTPAPAGSTPDTSAKDAPASNAAPTDASAKDATPSKETKEADNSDDEDSPPAKAEKPAVAKKPEAAPAKHAKAEKPKPTVARPAPKPAVAASNPSDAVSQAKKYLYGRGESQDCDRGLKLLKPVANQGNSKAMIEMGALYSAGLCTPRDLPTSYRWFALALRKEPDNSSVQTDLQKLWGEMTQPERQLAIKLTQ